MADYFSWNGIGLSDKARNQAMITSYTGKCQPENILKCQMHDRYYFTGAVIGIALDKLTPYVWKEKLIKNKLSLRQQLHQLFPMSNEEIIQRIASAKIKYQYDTITHDIDKIIITYQNEVKTQQATYAQLEGIPFTINKTPCPLSGQEKTLKTYFITSDYILHKNSSGKLSCPDSSISMNYNEIPFASQSRFFYKEIKLSLDTKIILDGIQTTAKKIIENKTTNHFNSILITNSQFQMQVTQHPGMIKVENDKLILVFSGVDLSSRRSI